MVELQIPCTEPVESMVRLQVPASVVLLYVTAHTPTAWAMDVIGVGGAAGLPPPPLPPQEAKRTESKNVIIIFMDYSLDFGVALYGQTLLVHIPHLGDYIETLSFVIEGRFNRYELRKTCIGRQLPVQVLAPTFS